MQAPKKITGVAYDKIYLLAFLLRQCGAEGAEPDTEMTEEEVETHPITLLAGGLTATASNAAEKATFFAKR